MTLNEVREVLAGAAWTRETPLVTLLDEIVERHDKATVGEAGEQKPALVTVAFAEYPRGQVSSGRMVQLLISLRQRYKMPLYAVGEAQ